MKTDRKFMDSQLAALEKESGLTQEALAHRVYFVLQSAYNINRLGETANDEKHLKYTFTSVSSRFSKTKVKFSTFPPRANYLDDHNIKKKEEERLPEAAIVVQKDYVRFQAFEKLQKRLTVPIGKKTPRYELLSPYTNFAISDKNFGRSNWIAQEFDVEKVEVVEAFQHQLYETVTTRKQITPFSVDESNVQTFLRQEALDLFQKHGFKVYIVLSGNRSIHLKTFFTSWIPKDELKAYAQSLKSCVQGLKADCSNLVSTMRIEGFYHHRAYTKFDDDPPPVGFGQHTLTRFLGTTTQVQNWDQLLYLERSEFTQEKLQALRKDLIEAGFMTTEAELPALTKAKAKKTSPNKKAQAEAQSEEIKENAERSEVSIPTNIHIPSSRAFNNNRTTLSEDEIKEILEGGIPAGHSWETIVESNLCIQLAMALGKDQAKQALIDLTHGHTSSAEVRKVRLKRLEIAFSTINLGIGSKSYSDEEFTKVQKALCRINSELMAKDRRSGFDAGSHLKVLEYIIARIQKEHKATYIGTEELRKALGFKHRMDVSRRMKLFCKHKSNPKPDFPLFVVEQEHCHVFSSVPKADKTAKWHKNARVRLIGLNLDYLKSL